MTVPEESRPKTRTPDDAGQAPDTERARNHEQDAGGTGRTLREALEEAQIRPDDFEDR
ncbi:hypothetical protein HCJ93_01500 [Streptomyces sp. SBST2-5]|uniref:Uncharacterized protein n=1 Tax=Streptomyces composti TaxID=2720025 RepID=A0ABX0ZXI0_9ACTN|nr:hypothetical protein [Streptomyces composti]NJP48784.1 hypothetical protein [Streptomyces composti]